jgi:hypothetical protein
MSTKCIRSILVNREQLPKTGIILEGRAHAGVIQDKYPPGRIAAALSEPVTADPEPVTADREAQNRPKHHGSENRQTEQIAGRVLPHIKSEVVRVAKLKGWTESKTVAALVEQALAKTLAEQFGVMLKTTIQDAITKQMHKENNRAANLALEAFYSAEEARIVTIYLLRFLLGGEDIALLPQIIKECQEQARENVSRALAEREPQRQAQN